MRTKKSRLVAAFISVVMMIMSLAIQMPISAASYEYPAQLVRVSISDNSRNINVGGYSNGSALNTWPTNGGQHENWRFDYKNGLFKLVNQGTGYVMTPAGAHRQTVLQ